MRAYILATLVTLVVFCFFQNYAFAGGTGSGSEFFLPDFTGMNIEDVLDYIIENELDSEVFTIPDEAPEGTVIGQFPEPGSPVEPGDTIFIDVSGGLEEEDPAILTLVKVVTNDNGGTKVVTDFQLRIDGAPVASGVPNILPPGTYTASEDPVSGYEASGWTGDCAANGTVILEPGDDKTCTITNDDIAPKLTLVKTVKNDDGGTKVVGDFQLRIDGAPVNSGVKTTLNAGLHTATEDVVTGYKPSDWGQDCAANGTVTLAPGDDKTCTIENDDIAPKLTLVKTVINDDGGTKGVGDFPLFINGGPVVSGVKNTLTPGFYTATETPDPGYTATPWGGDCAPNGTITLALGDDKTCAIINNDNELTTASLTLVKTVINDNGGTLGVGDFQLLIDGNSVTSGVPNILAPGTYTASEILHSGYSRSSWGGDCDFRGVITLVAGDNKTCTITNNDRKTELTVFKEVINDDGGTAVASDFTLRVSNSLFGSTSFAGVPDFGEGAGGVTVEISPGQTTVTEDPFPGYTSDGGQGNCSFEAELGATYECTFTNDDNPPQAASGTLTVITNVVNDHGGTAIPSNWTVDITGGSPSPNNFLGAGAPGVEVTINSDQSYAVNTSGGPPGYDQTLSPGCNFEQIGTFSPRIPPGGTETCTITLDDIPAELTVVKEVINDDGGEASPNDFTMNVSNPLFGSTSFPGVPIDEGASGTTIDISAGQTTVTEDPEEGYTSDGGVGDCDFVAVLGGDYQCTFTNDDDEQQAPTGTLTVIVNVTNDHGGVSTASDVNVNIQGGNPSQNDFPGSETGVDVEIDANADYNVTANPEFHNYDYTYSPGCSLFLPRVPAGGNVTCTITLDDIPAELTVSKFVFNDHGGEAIASDFTIIVDNPLFGSISFPGEANIDEGGGGTTIEIAAGPTVVDELDPGPEYEIVGFFGDCDFIAEPGEEYFCDVENHDIELATLTVYKEVINGDGGDADPSDFLMIVDNPLFGSVSFDGVPDFGEGQGGVTIDIAPGPTSVDEEDPGPDYELAELIGNCDFDAEPGGNYFCTVVNDDVPDSSVTIDDVEIEEGDDGSTAFVFTVTNSGSSGESFIVNYETEDGTATTADDDYEETSGSLFFDGDDGEQHTISIPVNGDEVVELDETFFVNISISETVDFNVQFNELVPNKRGANITDDQGEATIENDDSASFSIDDVEEVEGDAGTTDFVFTVTLDSDIDVGYSVTASTADDTATTGDDDYEANSEVLSFAGFAGEEETFTVTVNGDEDVEPDEEFEVNLSDPSPSIDTSERDVGIDDGEGIGTIENDDVVPGVFTVSIDDVEIDEGDDGTTAFVFTVTLDGDGEGSPEVDYSTSDDTATTGDDDYEATSGTLEFAGFDGEEETFTVTVNGDETVELDEEFIVTLSDCVGCTIADGTGEGTIENDDSASLSIDDVEEIEGDAGTTDFVFTVTLDGDIDTGIEVTASTSDDTATTGDDDYDANSEVLSFAGFDGEEETFTVTVNGDEDVETDEDFEVILSGLDDDGRDVDIDDGEGIGTITNDDFPPDPATLIVVKEVINDDGGTATASDWTMIITGASPSVNNFPGSETGVTVSITPDTPFSVDESPGPVGYSKTLSPECTDADGLPPGATATCTITNDDITPATLIVVKEVINDDGGTATASDWTMIITGASPSTNNFVGSESGVKVTINPNTPFSVDESPGPVGYSKTLSPECTDADGLPPGATATCTITNDDITPATLIVVKEVINDDGGTATASDWTMIITGASPSTNNFVGSESGVKVTINPNTPFSVDESPGPVGYSKTLSPECTDADGLPPGATATCTITNDDGSASTIVVHDFQEREAGSSETIDFEFGVSLKIGGGIPFSVIASTADGTATAADNDYQPNSATLNFNGTPGETKTFVVKVNVDDKEEGDETFFVNLNLPDSVVIPAQFEIDSDKRNATIVDGQAVGTILDDDSANGTSEDGDGEGSGPTFEVPQLLKVPNRAPISLNGNDMGISANNFAVDFNSIQGTALADLIPITSTIEVGQNTELKFTVYSEGGPNHIQHVALYTNLVDGTTGTADDTAIIYDRSKGIEILDDNGLFSNVNVRFVQDGNFMDIYYEITFGQELAVSDIFLKMWDVNNYSLYTPVHDFWEVTAPVEETQEKEEIFEELDPPVFPPVTEPVINNFDNIEKPPKLSLPNEDSLLNQLANSPNPESYASSNGITYIDGKVRVLVVLDSHSQETIDKIMRLGIVETENENLLQVLIPIENLSELYDIPLIRKVQPQALENLLPKEEQSTGVVQKSIVSEGLEFVNAEKAHERGIEGNGIKIAVLDSAFDITNPEISGNVADSQSFRHGEDGLVPLIGLGQEYVHGTAVAEIILDIAPNAELYLYTFSTEVEFLDVMDYAMLQEVDLITMSTGWANYPADGTSPMVKKIEKAIESGIPFVVSAGNYAETHWEGEFVDSDSNGWHEFSGVDEGLSVNANTFRVENQIPFVLYLTWDSPTSKVYDFDLRLVDEDGNDVAYSSNLQKTKHDIYFEYIVYVPKTEGTYSLGISSSDPTSDAILEVFSTRDVLEYPVSEGSVSVPTDAKGIISVGALNHENAELEPFSSQGPTNHGKQVPTIMGPDAVTTLAYDLNPFYGTSAAAPHVAGIVALMLEDNNELTPTEILETLADNAETSMITLIESNNMYGYGAANADFLACAAGTALIDNTCVPVECPTGEVVSDGVCMPGCPSGEVEADGVCMAECPANQAVSDGVCVFECPSGEVESDGVCVDESSLIKNTTDDQWNSRPTFGVNHATYGVNHETIRISYEPKATMVVEKGFTFNENSFSIIDNFHTPFAKQKINIGEVNTFTATVYAEKGLKIQEFLFGIPMKGEGHLAELGIEVWYDLLGEIEDISVVQKSKVIDDESITATHEKVKCKPSDYKEKCDATTISMIFYEPLKDDVMAIKAIDNKNRYQITYLNDGFDISGDSLNPMVTKLIPSPTKGEGLIKVTQFKKYSDYWGTDDGKIFEMNSFGSFKQINPTFERFQDTGNAFNRLHSGFEKIINYEQNRAKEVFNAASLVSELPESFAYTFPENQKRVTNEMIQEMIIQEHLAQKVIEEMNKQTRWN